MGGKKDYKLGLQLAGLLSLVSDMTIFSKEEWEAFSTLWKPLEAKRKTIITKPGQIEQYLYFVSEGVQRIYYEDDQSREATIVFTYAPSFGGVIDSLLLRKPSRYFYETLTPTLFLRASFSDILLMGQEIPAIDLLIRNGLSISLSGIMERMVEVQCFSSEDKLRTLFLRSPHIFQFVPHKYLANYIGIDATNFSKLMNNIKF